MRVPTLTSIRSKIVAFALAATLIPTLTTAWISYLQNKRSITAKVAEQLQSAAEQSTREIDLWTKERVYDAKVFASSYEVSENLERVLARSAVQVQARSRLTEYLRSVQGRLGDYRELMVVAPNGDVVATSATRPGPLHLPDRWLERVRSDDVVLGEPYENQDHVAEMMVAVPTLAANRRFLGVFAVRLTFQQLARLLESFAPGDGGRLHVVDHAGHPVISVPAAALARVAGDSATVPLAKLQAAGEPTVEYRSYDGTDVVGTVVPVSRLDWSVVTEVPQMRAYALIAQLGNRTAILVVAQLVIVGLLAYALGLSIVRPLDRLTDGASQVADGNLDVDVPVRAGGELGYLTRVFNDMVRRLREGHNELERISVTDALTGLPNRRRLFVILKEEVARAHRHDRPLAVLMMDVDHFKRYNDTYGHPAGDEVLSRIGALLQATLRAEDRVARYGGEEFLAVLPETDVAGSTDAADRVRTRLAKERFGAENVPVTLSVGAAVYPVDADNVERLVAAADRALYHAKKAGRDRVIAASAVPQSAMVPESGNGDGGPAADTPQPEDAKPTEGKRKAKKSRQRKAT